MTPIERLERWLEWHREFGGLRSTSSFDTGVTIGDLRAIVREYREMEAQLRESKEALDAEVMHSHTIAGKLNDQLREAQKDAAARLEADRKAREYWIAETGQTADWPTRGELFVWLMEQNRLAQDELSRIKAIAPGTHRSEANLLTCVKDLTVQLNEARDDTKRIGVAAEFLLGAFAPDELDALGVGREAIELRATIDAARAAGEKRA
jgi:hypothetical protein